MTLITLLICYLVSGYTVTISKDEFNVPWFVWMAIGIEAVLGGVRLIADLFHLFVMWFIS